MRKLYLFLVFCVFSIFSFSEDIVGVWYFDYILPDTIDTGKDLKPISDGDAMQINDDGSFHYEIYEAKLIANGTWNLEGNKLSLNYKLPKEKTRTYQISSAENSLILNEDGINYAFKKLVISPKAVATSGISFTSISRGFLGIISLLLIAFFFSKNRENINWILVIKGLGIQILFALLILKVPFISNGFEFIGKIFTKIISFTQDGTMFLFRSFETGIIESPLMNFVVMILPTVIFFSALTSLFYYWRIIPKIVYGFAWLMKRSMGLSGPESVAAAGNIFLGQTESPLLVKPYLEKMTMSEMLCLMSGGMATIAGGVLAAYIGFLGGDDPVQQIMFAKHLLAASVMSAPAAVIASKILLPESEKFEEKLDIQSAEVGSNALEAISKGTTDGLRLAVNVGAMLLVFIAMISMANYILLKIGDVTSLNTWIATNTRYAELSFNMILGYIGAPLAWLMGVCKEDMFLVGQLLGEKTVLNEFVAYVSLGEMKSTGAFLEEKSIIIATYILCGFANFASIGIQIGGIGALAPKRKGDLSRLGILALIAGTLASLFTAVIVGMIL
ncbi:MAG: Na+ dependent nucleoside transporter [Flavobacteriales bacterium]|nr:Na+ dependent nucleoside transporter [Flavobacteriales bacterium]|tara:strand:- start:24361 stop:26037 length:1677 start_codon:yes stop_codon:yes gene_type:complete